MGRLATPSNLIIYYNLMMQGYTLLQSCSSLLASYPGLPMFFNVHEKNQEGLVDFSDVMDVVCDDTHWNE